MPKTKKKWKENQEYTQENDEITQTKYITIKLYTWRKQRKKENKNAQNIWTELDQRSPEQSKNQWGKWAKIETNNQPTKIENNWSRTHNRYKRMRSEQRKRKRYEIRKRRSCSKQSND